MCPAPYRHHQHQSHPFPLHSVKNDNSENHCQANTPSYNKSWERLQELQIRNGFIKYWKTFVNWRGELFFQGLCDDLSEWESRTPRVPPALISVQRGHFVAKSFVLLEKDYGDKRKDKNQNLIWKSLWHVPGCSCYQSSCERGRTEFCFNIFIYIPEPGSFLLSNNKVRNGEN